MNSIVTVFRLAVLPLVIAVLGLVAIAVAPSRPTAAGDRGVYDSGERHTVSVAAEVAIVRAYLEIEEARLGDRLRCAFDVPDALTSCDVPALAMHTLVQNSVKHVAAARVEPTEIRVRVEARAGRLHLFVWDGGDKFDLDAIPAGHGLDMLRTRLDVLYGVAGRLAVQGAAGGKEVSISLPLRRPE